MRKTPCKQDVLRYPEDFRCLRLTGKSLFVECWIAVRSSCKTCVRVHRLRRERRIRRYHALVSVAVYTVRFACTRTNSTERRTRYYSHTTLRRNYIENLAQKVNGKYFLLAQPLRRRPSFRTELEKVVHLIHRDISTSIFINSIPNRRLDCPALIRPTMMGVEDAHTYDFPKKLERPLVRMRRTRRMTMLRKLVRKVMMYRCPQSGFPNPHSNSTSYRRQSAVSCNSSAISSTHH